MLENHVRPYQNHDSGLNPELKIDVLAYYLNYYF